MTEDHPTPLIKIALTGATGLLGRAVIAQLGATPTRLRRILRPPQQPGADDAMWNPATLELEDTALEGVDAVIHLAGESLAGGRWTAARKRRIRDSRVKGTHLIAQAVARARPKVFICASAVGLYGPTGETLVDEVSPSGKGFLAEVCEAWEAAAAPARSARACNSAASACTACMGSDEIPNTTTRGGKPAGRAKAGRSLSACMNWACTADREAWA